MRLWMCVNNKFNIIGSINYIRNLHFHSHLRCCSSIRASRWIILTDVPLLPVKSNRFHKNEIGWRPIIPPFFTLPESNRSFDTGGKMTRLGELGLTDPPWPSSREVLSNILREQHLEPRADDRTKAASLRPRRSWLVNTLRHNHRR